MEHCESKVGGICTREATWKQTVHAGQRDAGRFLNHSFWCDEHAESVTERRRREWLPPPKMVQMVAEIP
jgi:hypothetical protein